MLKIGKCINLLKAEEGPNSHNVCLNKRSHTQKRGVILSQNLNLVQKVIC